MVWVKFKVEDYFLNIKYESEICTAGVNFTNILCAAFSYKSLLSSFSVDTA